MAEKTGAGGKPQEFDERTGEYTSLPSAGRLVDGYERRFGKKVSGGIDLSDEAIPRSLSAKAKNYDIRMPDGGIAHLQEGTHITNKQVFAGAGTKTPIRDVDRLVRQYGGEAHKWAKVKAVAILNHNGKTGKAEIHWYEEPTTGKQEMKLKMQPNGDWWL